VTSPDTIRGFVPGFRPPPLRAGIVQRTALVDRLLDCDAGSVVAITAPAGYGKTTLMSAWAEKESRPVAWLTAHREDNDPNVLLRNLKQAVQVAALSAGPVSELMVAAGEALTTGITRLAAALTEVPRLVLMIDGAEVITTRDARDVLAETVLRFPPTITVAIASRSEPPLRGPMLRAAGRLLELTPGDLAMSEDEAAALLRSAGVDPRGYLRRAVERTEGWPAGLYLTAAAVKSGTSWETVLDIGGNDRFLGDYLQHEVLAAISSTQREFLRRTSVLDHLTASLCDHVLQRTRSASALERLEAVNMLVIPLDRTRTWYRYHTLLRDHLQVELHRTDPDGAGEIHRRALEWFDAHGMHSDAIHHALEAGDAARAAPLILQTGRLAYATGETESVLSWVEWFERTNQVAHFPQIAVLAGFAHVLEGHEVSAKRWAALVIDGSDPKPDLPPLVRLLRAIMAPFGLEVATSDAEAAAQSIGRDSGWYPAALLLRGLTRLWTGDVDRAEVDLRKAIRAAHELTAPPTAGYALASLATICLDRGDVEEACDLASRSVEAVRETGIEHLATSCLPFVIAARCAVRSGDPAAARRLLAQAGAARSRLNRAIPGPTMHTLLEMTGAFIEIADVAGAREAMRHLTELASDGFGTLDSRRTELKQVLASLPKGRIGPSTLTNAELKLLPFLATHLSFPEIGDRLFVSRHTVKTQAMSIYRKLGVSSRGEAVARADELGFLKA
jgi:LuxR family transcriptional regulator, maltose regulon positive regulatory protein